jgi:putative PIN family toxin of toxin-antitoxin system
VLKAVRSRRLEVVASWELAEEVIEVLRRPRITRYGTTEREIQDVLAILAPFLPSVDVTVAIRDPDDAPVVGAAVAGNADAIVTGDRDLLEDRALIDWLAERRIEVLTADLLNRV